MSDSETGFDGLGSIIRAAGIHLPARARFAGEAMLTATLSSLTFGLVCGQVGSMIPTVGPLAPFLCGSWLGYSAGLLTQWWSCQRLARLYAKKYPSLMIYALQHQDWDGVGEPVRCDEEYLEDWITQGGLARTTCSILAAQSVKTCVDEIEERGRRQAAEQYCKD
jgi:hypothetical protein